MGNKKIKSGFQRNKFVGMKIFGNNNTNVHCAIVLNAWNKMHRSSLLWHIDY